MKSFQAMTKGHAIWECSILHGQLLENIISTPTQAKALIKALPTQTENVLKGKLDSEEIPRGLKSISIL